MNWDPRDTGDDPEDDPPEPVSGWIVLLVAVLWLAVAGSLLFQCSQAKAQPFAVVLPDGTETIACGLRYDVPPAKLVTLEPCVIVFTDSFEG